MQLHDYQELAVLEIIKQYSLGNKKVLLHLATGAGKTFIFSHLLKLSADKGKSALMIVRGRNLVKQASDRLNKEGVHHGVIMAGYSLADARIQICSIDTLKRRDQKPKADFIVIDECHLFLSKKNVEFMNHYPDSYFLSVTATPYTKQSLQHLADTIVHPASMKWLMDNDHLRPARYFAPSRPCLYDVKVERGDYVSEFLEPKMGVLTGGIVEHWRKLGENRPTVCFAVNIKHSKDIVETFNRAGIKAEHIEGDTLDEERQKALDRLQSGETKIISNVGILCVGVDMPWLSCIIMARPTKSYALYIQQAGRGTRKFEGKKNFILLDHAGNVLRHGLITEEPSVEIAGMQKKRQPITLTTCQKCFAVHSNKICPDCGTEKSRKPLQSPQFENGILSEFKEDPIRQRAHEIKEEKESREHRYEWMWHTMAREYDYNTADKFFTRPWKLRKTSPTYW